MVSILRYSNAEWEKLSIFLNFLTPKLPAPKEDDLSRGILKTIEMDNYRVEVKSSQKIGLADQDAEVGPVPTTGGGRKPEPALDQLSNIVKAFNDQFGNIEWKDADKIRKVIAEEISARVSVDAAYQNAMKNSDKQNARIEHDKDLQDENGKTTQEFISIKLLIQWRRSARDTEEFGIELSYQSPQTIYAISIGGWAKFPTCDVSGG